MQQANAPLSEMEKEAKGEEKERLQCSLMLLEDRFLFNDKKWANAVLPGLGEHLPSLHEVLFL